VKASSVEDRLGAADATPPLLFGLVMNVLSSCLLKASASSLNCLSKHGTVSMGRPGFEAACSKLWCKADLSDFFR
jgi:hypothetical protein